MMPTKTQEPSRLPFRVLIRVPSGPMLVSEPLTELPARLLVNGALRVGDQAEMVENHGPRHRWGEQVFAASKVETATVLSGCTCGQCVPHQFAVRVAQVPIDFQLVDALAGPDPLPVSRESPRPAIAWRGIASDAISGLLAGAAAAFGLNLLARLVFGLVGGAP